LVWGRCKLGPRRIYWVVCFCDSEGPHADGYAATVREAEAAALDVVARLEGRYDKVRRTTTVNVAYWHKVKVAGRREREGGKPGGAQVREYLYTHYQPDEGPSYWRAHPILKKTRKQVWVPRRSCPLEVLGTAEEAHRLRVVDEHEDAIILDRESLEQTGQAGSRRYHLSDFHVRPEEDYRPRLEEVGTATRLALELLGLCWPCSPAELKEAYRRRSKETHPDVGGSAEAFRRVDEAYERVAAIV
jgi:hypothetical protein